MRKLFIPFLGIISIAILGSASGCQGGEKVAEEATDAVEEAVEVVAQEEVKEEIERKNHKIKISTEFGDMIAILYDETPQHRDNFVKLANEGFYNDLLFHRVMQGFMIQGGDPESKGAEPGRRLGTGGPGYTIEAEFRSEFYHKKGALAAARQPDQVNPQKRSSGSQFYVVQGKPTPEPQLMMIERSLNQKRDSSNFIHFNEEQVQAYSQAGTPFLDGEYTVFGEVIEGLEVIDKVALAQVDRNNRPIEDIKMTVSVIE